MKKILTILGARPQFVKAAVLSRVILKHQEVEEIIVHTGQHYDANMSDIFFSEMEIPKPKYNLAINGLSHGAMTGQMLQKIEEVLVLEKPDAVVVFGDTNSTLAGALAAKKLHIKVVHIEAGLRSFNMKMPEEINRILTDRISDLLLCPTDSAIDNLVNEGFENMPSKIVKSGDIMKDAVEYYSQFSQEKSTIISDLNLKKNEFVLATIHRQENTDDLVNLNSIFAGLETIGNEKTVVLPLHPRTKAILKANNLNFNIKIIDPVGYFDMLELLKNCNLVVTDSGGLQKEAFFNKKHCIIAREETEWIELVSNGFAKIVGGDAVKMVQAFIAFQDSTANFKMDLYGANVGENMYKEILKIL
ncbi:non-hydrolyzing UDP-N-acetylglucosamine 2-epimerase [Lutibacter sp.]|uniref:non-hydrolyzing UDP-N-acetylglucosamine 2-epimerase n=1 Tax=Lutibacter sp. TaxID=1925666 RepID=UPI001A27671E|nr:UDP-N-acetylglucosamine 2-epimerase (non-hydrolyzing) [Lutibacter sp.]MBI9042711.1 UDP-N-acetylglucosamine 2-epimerase (non-hydrolyzing) [Lutibacter sp.]